MTRDASMAAFKAFRANARDAQFEMVLFAGDACGRFETVREGIIRHLAARFADEVRVRTRPCVVSCSRQCVEPLNEPQRSEFVQDAVD